MKKWLNIILILICALEIGGWFVFRVRHVENIVTKFADGNYRILWNDYILPDIRDPEERMFFAYMVNSSDKPLDTRLNHCFLKQANKTIYLFKPYKSIMLDLLLTTHDSFLSCMQEVYIEVHESFKKGIDSMYKDFYTKFSPYRTAK